MVGRIVILCLWGVSTLALAGEKSVAQIATEVAGEDGTSFERAQRLVKWMNETFEWTYTDYEQRSVEQILERRGGNCAEQARVLTALYAAAGIETRWVAEINIHPESEQRRRTAEAKIAEHGKQMSVFGLLHNDHRWLEVRDEKTDQWQPSDPTLGLIGLHDWVGARVGFADRPEPARDMIVPFVVVVREGGKLVEDRSRHYLVDAFNAYYEGKLSPLEAWPAWTALVDELSALGAKAFTGEVNLHEHVELMRRYRETYESLRAQYEALAR